MPEKNMENTENQSERSVNEATEKLIQEIVESKFIKILTNSVGIVDRFGINIREGMKSIGGGLTDVAHSIDNAVTQLKPNLDDITNSGVDLKIGRKNKFFGRKS